MYDHNYFSEPPHEEKANLIQTAQWGSGRGEVQPHTDLPAIHKASLPRVRWDPSGTQPQSKSPQSAMGPQRNTATLKCCVKPETYPMLL